MARKIEVQILGDASSLERSFGRSSAAAKGFSHNIGFSFGTLLKSTLIIDGVQKALEGLRATVHLGVEEFADNAKVAAQSAAALRSTGAIAGVTLKQIDALGLSLSNLSGVDDEVVRSGENILLSFTKIRNQVGKGNNIFTRATKDALDFATRTGRDVPTAARILGVALENPARKATALSRAGIVLTKAQLDLIKSLQSSGHALDAQKLILGEVEKRFGGAAKAAGQTLPGQLNVLRDRFKDLVGSGVGLVAPSVAKAATGLTDFVKRISVAQGARAKFSIVFSGIEGLGPRLLKLVRREFDRIDWSEVFNGLKDAVRLEGHVLRSDLGQFADIARSAGARIQSAFRAIDWAKVGRAIITGLGDAGKAAGRGLVAITDGITNGLRRVNFSKIGKALVDGFASAVVAVGNFLIHVNWGALIGASIRLAVTVIKGLGSLLLGAGKELGGLLVKGIGAGIRALAALAEKEVLKLVLKLLKPLDFSFSLFGVTISTHLGGAVKALQGKLADLQGSIDKLHGKTLTMNVETTVNGKGREAPLDLGQVAGARAAANAAKRKPLDTGLGLTDSSGAVAAAATKASDALQRLMDTLNLAVAKATLTKTFKDDLAENQALITALKQQIALHRDNLSLQNDLVSAQQARLALVQQQNDAEVAARNARQFRTLGLDATGQALIPGKAGLSRELAKVTAAIGGSFLDTGKTRKVLEAIRKLILDPFTKVSKEVRSTIKQMLDDLTNQLNNSSGNLTKFHKASANAILSGLGLSPDQTRALRARLSQVGVNGGTVGGGNGAFGLALPSGDIVVHTNVNLDGQKVATNTTKHQQRRARRNPAQRRGPHAGT